MLEYKSASIGDIATVLHGLNYIISTPTSLKDTVSQLFQLLEIHAGLRKGVLMLRDSITDRLYIEIAFGFTEADLHSPLFDFIQSVNASILESEAPYANTLDKERIQGLSPELKKLSLIGLPLAMGDEKIGTLSVLCKSECEPDRDGTRHLMSIISIFVAQEIKLKRLVESEKEALKQENLLLRDELKSRYNIHNMIGNSNAMHQVYESIIQVAHSNATVLIRGESGTGKELVAHAIHYNSPRASMPFIKINCGAIPESLIESELFGYEKGAFTDAQDVKLGKFEAAHGGTIFLDEVGELAPAVQVKLLRVLQEKEIERVGGLYPIKVNVRVVTATNKDLEQELVEKRFREDLYYRLNVFPIFLPALKERHADILLLAEHFLDKYTKENNKIISRISSLAIDLLSSYHWPGNVRELENCMERAVLVCKTDTIQATDLPPSLQRVDTTNTHVEGLSYQSMVENFERELIIDALKKSKGNKSKASEYLNATQRIIGYKIQTLGINISKFKSKSL